MTRPHPRSHRPSSRESRGQSLVELTLVIPILLLLLLIGIDFGRVYLGYVNLQSLARIAANFAANNPSVDWSNDSDARVQTYIRMVNADATASNCEMQPDAANHTPPRPEYPDGTALGKTARVQMTCRFGLITPIIGSILGQSIAVSASSDFPIKSGGVAGIGVGAVGSNVPVAAFAGSPLSGTAPLDVVFTDLSTNGPAHWKWDFGDGTIVEGDLPDDENPSHTYTDTGNYTVTLIASNAAGEDTATKLNYIVVADTSVANFSADPTSGTAPLTVHFQDLSGGSPTTWSWTFGDGASSTLQNPDHAYNAAGIYSVTLSIDGPGGPATQTKTDLVVVAAPQCTVPNVSDGTTKKVQATSTLEGAGFAVVANGDSSNWKVRVQDPQGGLPVDCGSTVTIYQ